MIPISRLIDGVTIAQDARRDEPLLHYVGSGEQQGFQPSRHFDPGWYRRRYELGPSVLALAHYLTHWRTPLFSPLPSFNLAAYVEENIATLLPNRDPYMHFLVSRQRGARRDLPDYGAAA